MSLLVINFYDEEIQIPIPRTLQSLKQEISQKYAFDQADVEELVLFYQTQYGKMRIMTENQYQLAINDTPSNPIFKDTHKILTIYIEVTERSKLFLRELERSEVIFKMIIRSNHCDPEQISKDANLNYGYNENQVSSLVLEKDKFEKIQQNENISCEMKEELINKTIIEMISLNVSQDIDDNAVKKVDEASQAVEEDFQKETDASCTSPTMNNYQQEKTIEKKDVVSPVHKDIICDGCGLNPIIGVRYHCTVCKDFDFCESCEQTNGEEHQHSMIKYRQPQLSHNQNKTDFVSTCLEYYKRCKDIFLCKRSPSEGGSTNEKRNMYLKYVEEIRENYQLDDFTDNEIISSLMKSNGKIEEAVGYLYNLK